MNRDLPRHQKLPSVEPQRLSALPRSERQSPDRLDAGIASKLANWEISAPDQSEERTFLSSFEGTHPPESSRT